MADVSVEDELERTLGLVYDAIHINNDAMEDNPDSDQTLELMRRSARLEAERAALEALLDSMADGDDIDVSPPSAEQVQAIANLTAAVSTQTAGARTVAEALELTGKILDLATDLAGS